MQTGEAEEAEAEAEGSEAFAEGSILATNEVRVAISQTKNTE